MVNGRDPIEACVLSVCTRAAAVRSVKHVESMLSLLLAFTRSLVHPERKLASQATRAMLRPPARCYRVFSQPMFPAQRSRLPKPVPRHRPLPLQCRCVALQFWVLFSALLTAGMWLCMWTRSLKKNPGPPTFQVLPGVQPTDVPSAAVEMPEARAETQAVAVAVSLCCQCCLAVLHC